MRGWKTALGAALTVVAGATFVACSGGGANSGNQAKAATPVATQFAPVVAASELVVGQNRFALGIIDQKTGQPVPDAATRFRFLKMESANQATPKSEADAKFIAPARDAGISGVVLHQHADGSAHPHVNVETDVGVYVAPVTFDQPGDWAVEATFTTKDGRPGKVVTGFKVTPQSQTPAVGSQAPRSKNATAADVTDVTQISTAIDPTPALYQETVDGAIAAGRPALVAFVTPGYCSTRFCGPAYEVVKKLIPTYGDKAALIHIEIYKDPLTKTLAEPVKEWKLQSEPYIFVIDRNGVITAKFEGPVSLAELDDAMKKVTS